MRKLMSLLVMVGLFFLAGCSLSPKPETTVSNFIEAGKKYDTTKMSALVANADANGKAKLSELGNENQYQTYFLDYFKENAGKITYTITNAQVKNNSATVTVNFKFIDGLPLLKATLGNVFTKALAGAFSGVKMTEEETKQMIVTAITKQKETNAESFTDQTIEIKLAKVDDQWFIVEPSDELLNVFLSNFNSIGKELGKSMTSNITKQS
ncbi:DUF4878 domain-containing protein [Heliobacillus mobilis]|uniref:DUF4878 domain-containing protein n=1 Tax=Heliobacterium mobile TaxID=28064 RepID=A0A6I3SGI3_HELMO|nr:DUF4878 domain-containing protein [Heliobacterium mobile]MTV47932.1 DUF4878 domain-containing protein [Heliobacterium mobile]